MALNDLDNAYELLAKQSEEAASHTIELILNKADQLLDFPESGSKEPKLSHRKKEYRYLVKNHHKVIYRIESTKIFIVRVFDTRKDPRNLQR